MEQQKKMTDKMKVAIIDKAPSRNDYSKFFTFEFDSWHMCSNPPANGKVLKKDIDLELEPDEYDLIILVGAEAAKHYAGIKSTVTMSGTLVKDKFVAMPNPAMLHFKPEMKKDIDMAVSKIHKYVAGEKTSTQIGDFKGINNTAEALEYLQSVVDLIKSGKCTHTAWDTETTALYPRDGHVLGLSLSYQIRQGRYLLTDILEEQHIELLQWIANNSEVIFHNMKFDRKMINYHLDITFRKDHVHDTMCMHYILDENDSHGLKQIAQKFTDYGDYDSELDTFKKKYCHENGIKEDEFTYDLIPYDIMSSYASMDTAVTWEIFWIFWGALEKNPKLMSAYLDLMIRSTLFLGDIEEVGIPFDQERLAAADTYLDREIVKANEELRSFKELQNFEEANGAVFNPASPIQLRRLLFDYIGLTPTGKLTATGALSTDADVLEELSSDHPIPQKLLTIRKLTKLRNSYTTKLIKVVNRDGRVRTNFNNTFVTSGRLSSSGTFNAQQITRDDPIIKGCIVAPKGYKIVSQDLQTGEMYYAAVLSGDKNLQSVFKAGGDFHSAIAKMVFNLPCEVEEVKAKFPVMRQSAKAISFGILYGSGPAKVQATVQQALIDAKIDQTYTLEDAKTDINTYFTRFSKLRKWLNDRKTFIATNGFTYSFFGRKRRLPNVFSTDKGIAASEVRSGVNSEIQSVCSDVNLLGAMDTHDELARKGMKAKIFMLVHDSIVALVPEQELTEYCEILKRNTQKDRGCGIAGVPIGVDQEDGEDYSFGKWDKFYKLESGSLSRLPTAK